MHKLLIFSINCDQRGDDIHKSPTSRQTLKLCKSSGEGVMRLFVEQGLQHVTSLTEKHHKHQVLLGRQSSCKDQGRLRLERWQAARKAQR